MKNLMKSPDILSVNPLKEGEIVEGKVLGLGRSSLFLDLGPRGTGIIYGREYHKARGKLKDLKKGDVILAKVTDSENEEGYIELSLDQASEELTWQDLKEKHDNDELIKVKITGANTGGLLTEVSNIPAFIPVSQLSSEHYPRVEGGERAKILSELQKFIGAELEVKIFDTDPKENKLILSEKAKDKNKTKEILKEFKVGEIIEGEITGLVDFGAFIKFGKTEESIEGLIHISELSWQLINDPRDVVKVGDKVKAKIVEITDDKVSLSLKAMNPNPWEDIESKFKKGDVLQGKVVKFNPFGAFVEIIPGIQGLIHISEFGTKEKMEESLEVNKSYKFEILSLDPKRYKISLKLVKAD